MKEPEEITLRDYFAAKAIQGLLACSETTGDGNSFAKTSYQIADAMLAERNKESSK